MKYLDALYYMYYVNVDIYDYSFDITIIEKKGKRYLKEFACFDIETSSIHTIQQSFMYVWQFYIGGVVVVGRTWQEFITFIKKIQEIIGDSKLVVYVHNLSYEFQFLSGIYNFLTEQVFAVDRRKVLKAMMGNIEFRCSYLLSNMSLALYTKKMNVMNKKLTGELNYAIMRYSDTKLSHQELAYCINDVVGLHQSIEKEMEMFKDTVISIPLTSTGYVRRDCKKVMYKYKRTLIDKIYPTFKCYELLREAFRGGNTHANRYYVNMVLENIKNIDISSSYPYVLNNMKFPITKLIPVKCNTIAELENYIKQGKAVLFKLVASKVELRDELWGAPYLSVDKCRGMHDYINDNGRILSADILETTITDVDYKIIAKEYKWEKAVVKEVYIANYGYLPDELKDVINKYFKSKTELKGIADFAVFYEKMKNMLNAIYGMTAQNPVKQNILYIDNEFKEQDNNEWSILLESQKTAFLPYQWGVWTTAHARAQLEKGIEMAGHNFVYCDTDSVKYRGELTGLDDFNAEAMFLSEQTMSYATNKKTGITYFMGTFEHEKPYKRFITFGAKKYAFEYENGETGITIAGVNKKKGAEELTRRGGLNKLKPGFIFRDSAGLEMIYNDNAYGYYNIDGHKIYITKNIYAHDSTYQLSMTPTFSELVEKCSHVRKHLLQNY